jgi:hypothetical protein
VCRAPRDRGPSSSPAFLATTVISRAKGSPVLDLRASTCDARPPGRRVRPVTADRAEHAAAHDRRSDPDDSSATSRSSRAPGCPPSRPCICRNAAVANAHPGRRSRLTPPFLRSPFPGRVAQVAAALVTGARALRPATKMAD